MTQGRMPQTKPANGNRVVKIGALIVAGLSVIGVGTAWKMYSMIRTAPGPMKSPDGSMIVVQSITDSHGNPETHMRVAFEILDAKTGTLIYRRQTRASALRRWDLNWMSNDRLTLLSTEIGRLIWTRDEKGQWVDDPMNADGVVPAAVGASSRP